MNITPQWSDHRRNSEVIVDVFEYLRGVYKAKYVYYEINTNEIVVVQPHCTFTYATFNNFHELILFCYGMWWRGQMQ